MSDELSSAPADGVAIRSDGHVVRLKWHRMKRRIDDIPFTPTLLAEALAVGASSEIDLRLHGEGGFVVLHDETLDRETTGSGPVAAARTGDLRALKMRAPDGAVTAEPVLLLDDMVRLAAEAAAPGALVQLDLKEDHAAIDAGVASRFGATIAPATERFILSGGNWEAVRRLVEAAPGLAAGFDPCDEGVTQRLLDRSAFESFVAEAVERAPTASMIYLEYPLILSAATLGYDMVAAFHRSGRTVDAYTLNMAHPLVAGTLRTLVGLRVDQITTDEPVELQRLFEKSSTSHG